MGLSLFRRSVARTLVASACAVAAGCATSDSARPSPFPTMPAPAWAATSSVTSGGDPLLAPAVDAVVQTALGLQGVPYRMGGEDPASGFDCSGFVQYVFALHQVELPRIVGDQYRSGVRVSLPQVRSGDLVFFTTTAPGATHVGIAVGGGEFVHAPNERGVVRVEHLDTPYWHDRFVGARRVF
jgi:cell wall-associated NlpC family hydrolase